jgi:hypothetical protein
MNIHDGMEVQLQAFLTSVLDLDKGLTSDFSRPTLKESTLGTQETGCIVGTTVRPSRLRHKLCIVMAKRQ